MVDWTSADKRSDGNDFRQNFADWFYGVCNKDDDFSRHAEYWILRRLQHLIPPGERLAVGFNGGKYDLQVGLGTFLLADQKGRKFEAHRFEMEVHETNPFRGRALGTRPESNTAARFASSAFLDSQPPSPCTMPECENRGLAMCLLSNFLGVRDRAVADNCRVLIKEERKKTAEEAAIRRQRLSDLKAAEKFMRDRLRHLDSPPPGKSARLDALDHRKKEFHRAFAAFLSSFETGELTPRNANYAAKCEAGIIWSLEKNIGSRTMELQREGFLLDIRPRSIVLATEARPEALKFKPDAQSRAEGFDQTPRTVELRVAARRLDPKSGKYGDLVIAEYVSPRYSFSTEMLSASGGRGRNNIGFALFLLAIAGDALDRGVAEKCLELNKFEINQFEQRLSYLEKKMAFLNRSEKAIAKGITLDSPGTDKRQEKIRRPG